MVARLLLTDQVYPLLITSKPLAESIKVLNFWNKLGQLKEIISISGDAKGRCAMLAFPRILSLQLLYCVRRWMTPGPKPGFLRNYDSVVHTLHFHLKYCLALCVSLNCESRLNSGLCVETVWEHLQMKSKVKGSI